MTVEVTFPRSRVEVREFEHPNGETGILIGLRVSSSELASAYEIPGTHDGDDSIVMPLKHKADGATNFDTYRYDDDDIVIEHTDEQYEQVRSYLATTL